MVTVIFLPEGRWEGGHAPCHSLLWKWMSVVMVILIPLAKTSTLLFLRSQGLWWWSPSSHF